MRRLLGGFFHHEHHVANLELTLGRHQGQLAGVASGLQIAQASLDTVQLSLRSRNGSGLNLGALLDLRVALSLTQAAQGLSNIRQDLLE